MRKLIMTGLAVAAVASWLLLTTADGRERTPARTSRAAEAQVRGASAMRRRPRALLPVVMHQPPPTPTVVPLPSLSGRVFFDYNGNGLQDAGEPGIRDVPVCIDSLDSGLCATSGADGSYSIPLASVPGGTHDVYVQSPTDEPATAFRYINKWNGPVVIPAYKMNGVQVPEQHLNDTEVLPIDRSLEVIVGEDDVDMDVALMQGFLTMPFRCADVSKIYDYHGFDRDPRVGFVVDYRGDTTISHHPGEPGTGDQHDGHDWFVPVGTFLVASAPGIMTHEFINPDNGSRVGRLENWTIQNRPGYFTVLLYAHHSVPLVRDAPGAYVGGQGPEVHRGQIIELSGMTGTGDPHLHFAEAGNSLPGFGEDFQTYDAYGAEYPTADPSERISDWTVYNSPVCYPN